MRYRHCTPPLVAAAVLILAAGCASEETNPERDFNTSGSREADQRAEQRVAKVQQLRGEGTEVDPAKKSLYERLGGEVGLTKITDDFLQRALADPRVNWSRKGTKTGGVLGIGEKSAEWDASPANVAQLKKHMVRFLSIATGGPVEYDGQSMKNAHAGMAITNAEFDAAVGDLKATLDAFRVGIDEQKELLAIVESTRPQIVEER